MPRNFRELEAKMSPEARARSRALVNQCLASAQRDAAEADIARWFEKLGEFGPEPFGGENGLQPTPKKWLTEGPPPFRKERERMGHPPAGSREGASCIDIGQSQNRGWW
jgi:hypothetical protein